MKIYNYKVNNLINNQKQEIINLILKKYPCKHSDKEKELEVFLKSVFDFFVDVNEDLFVAYENEKIIGFAFVCVNGDFKKDSQVIAKIEKIFDANNYDSYINQYLDLFYNELNDFKPLVNKTNFDNDCIITLCQFFEEENKEALNWFICNLLNYYLLQNREYVCVYKINQEFNKLLNQFCLDNNVSFTINDYGFEISNNRVLIDKFDYINFTQENIVNSLSFKFANLNTKGMWTKTFISPVHPENNIIMIHGVNSYGITFINLIPFLLNYGNVIILDLPIHEKSKPHSYLNIEWNMINYALFLANWINHQKYENIYLYGHSMGGGIAAVLNILLYNQVKGLIIEDGYNGYCSIVNQKITSMTKSLLKSLKQKKELKKNKLTDNIKNPEFSDFYDIYKPITKKTWMFFLNLFNVDVLLNVDEAYMLNLKKSLAIYGVMDGVVNAQEAKKFFSLLGNNWKFEFIQNATHSSHEENLPEVKKFVCEYLTSLTNIEYEKDYDINEVKTSINIGCPYTKKDHSFGEKVSLFFKNLLKK